MRKQSLVSLLLAAVMLAACATPAATPEPAATTAPETTPEATQETEAPREQADLSGLKSYVEKKSDELNTSIGQMQAASDSYYELAKAANFDYAALWADKPEEVLKALGDARTAFLAANPQYEQMEGVVAGVPSLSEYDVILDAGAAGDGEDAVPFDLILPDGRVLPKPGNLFEVTESTLWGTDPSYVVADIHPDFNSNGEVDLGDSMPDANVLKGAADTFAKYTADLKVSAAGWEPTEAEAFGALVANVPTFADFIESWKNSRQVQGDTSTERGFVATSRLSDLSDNILSWQTIYAGLSPAASQIAPDEDAQITQDLADLQKYVSDLYQQEKDGKRFTPEEADTFSAEGQNRATAIAGQIAQVAAQMDIELETP